MSGKNESYPHAAQELIDNLYVDDLLTGADTAEDCLQLLKKCCEIVDGAHLPLKKWVSNSKEVIENIDEESRGSTGERLLTCNLADASDVYTSTLGVEWNVQTDELTYSGFSTMKPDIDKVTKRIIASVAAQLFDPFIITAKMIIQELWKENVDWDTDVPTEIKKKWLT